MALGSRCKDDGINLEKTPFDDVMAGTWEARVVNKGVELGIITTENVKFRPTDTITREEALKMLFLVRNIDVELIDVNTSSYEDVSGWSIKYVEASRIKNIIVSNTNLFRPTDPITREESAKIVYNVMNLK